MHRTPCTRVRLAIVQPIKCLTVQFVGSWARFLLDTFGVAYMQVFQFTRLDAYGTSEA